MYVYKYSQTKKEIVLCYEKVAWKILKFASGKRAIPDILISCRDVAMLVMLILLLQIKVGNSYFIVRLGGKQNGTHRSAPIYCEK